MPFLGKERTLFHLFGLPVRANLSWLFLVALVMASLATGYFPGRLPGAPTRLYWVLAFLGTLGLFASLILHELCHSLVARATGMPVSGITLFIFGGVSQLEDEPPTAGSEFLMAVVGPLASLVLGVLLGVAWYLTGVVDAAPTLRALFGYLCLINLVLAAFNSLPAFPLDGGRVLRSLLWGITGDLRIATRVAVGIGSAFGLGLVFLGVVFVFMVPGGVVSGVWFIVIGFFVRYAATSSLRMATMRHHLEGEQIRRFMSETVVTVPDEMPLSDFVEQFVFRHRYAYYPVVDAMGRLVGIMSARGPGSVERDRWPSTPVRDVMTPLDSVLVLPPEADAVEALMALRSAEASRVVVAEHGRPVGVVSLRDLLGFLALKIDLDAAHVT